MRILFPVPQHFHGMNLRLEHCQLNPQKNRASVNHFEGWFLLPIRVQSWFLIMLPSFGFSLVRCTCFSSFGKMMEPSPHHAIMNSYYYRFSHWRKNDDFLEMHFPFFPKIIHIPFIFFLQSNCAFCIAPRNLKAAQTLAYFHILVYDHIRNNQLKIICSFSNWAFFQRQSPCEMMCLSVAMPLVHH